MIAVSEEEIRIAEIKERVTDRQRKCEEDFAKAEPAVRQAAAALDTLNKVSFYLNQVLQPIKRSIGNTRINFIARFAEQFDRVKVVCDPTRRCVTRRRSCFSSILAQGKSSQGQKLESL